MDLPAQLADELARLALGVGAGGDGVVEGLSALVATLTEAVSGYAGLRLTLVHTGHPVEISALLPPENGKEAVTSLRLPLPLISSAFEDGGRLVVWSTTAGALVDLAADLDYVFGPSAAGDLPRDRVSLDVDLPVPAATSGVEGTAELATIHRAAGLLVDRGHDIETVHDTMRRDAAAAGLSTHDFAARLLRRR